MNPPPPFDLLPKKDIEDFIEIVVSNKVLFQQYTEALHKYLQKRGPQILPLNEEDATQNFKLYLQTAIFILLQERINHVQEKLRKNPHSH